MADPDRRRGAEAKRLLEDARHQKSWKRLGPCLSERQWGTVRGDRGETGRGPGAGHQTGWTARVLRWLEDPARERGRR